jgi:hypothetical protein
MARRPLPPPRNLDRAIEASPSLAGLLAGHRRSQQCFAQVRTVLPELLRALVRPGPIEEGSWTLFAQHASAASKLRQWLPTLVERAAEREPTIKEIKVKILPLER